MSTNKRKSNIVGRIACVVFALLSFAFGISMSLQVYQMESVGIQADATVIRIETGAKNSKFAIVGFQAKNAGEIEAKCLFQMFVIRSRTGDKVTVLYDPSEPETVMIDNGIWNWDQPFFGLLGGFLLLGLVLLLIKSQPKQSSASEIGAD